MSEKLKPVSFKKPRGHAPRLSPEYVPGVRHERYWTDAELGIIRKYYPKGGLVACQAKLGQHRTLSSIYQKAIILGIGNGKVKCRKPADLDARVLAAWPTLNGKKRGEVSDLAAKLKVPRHLVSQSARKQGLTIAQMKEPRWTAAEDNLMREVPLHNPKRAATIFREHGFKRSETAIVVRAKRLYLSRRTYEHLNSRQAAEILGVDSKSITGDILKGFLKATRRGTQRLPQQGGDWWSITRADFRNYIVEQIAAIDLRKVDKVAFVDLLVSEGKQS